MSQPEKAIPQNQADAMPGGVTRAVAVEDTTNDVVRYGDAANKAVRVNVVAGGGGGGGTVTQGPAGNPNDPWNMEVTEDGTDLPVKAGDAANKAVRVVLVVDATGTKGVNLAQVGGFPTDVGNGVADVATQRVALALGATVMAQPLAPATSHDTYVGPADGSTTQVADYAPTLYALQVIATGAVTSWTVVLEVSLDAGVTFGIIATHTNADGTGGVVTPVRPTPAQVFRTRCVAIVLGAGTQIDAYVNAVS